MNVNRIVVQVNFKFVFILTRDPKQGCARLRNISTYIILVHNHILFRVLRYLNLLSDNLAED
jgi:hypothetical protein